MILEVYAVFDKAVDAYMQPFFCRSKGEAIRSFMSACQDEKATFNRNAPDYTLYYIGTWNDNSGLVDSKLPERVISAPECLAQS